MMVLEGRDERWFRWDMYERWVCKRKLRVEYDGHVMYVKLVPTNVGSGCGWQVAVVMVLEGKER